MLAYYDGKEFENGNTIILHYASEYGIPGLMGIIAAAILQQVCRTWALRF
ncbi:hypothetical protein OK016_21305 [Vibrio chagasii]|nr:hypothetical protein [Vibrio chagasii]